MFGEIAKDKFGFSLVDVVSTPVPLTGGKISVKAFPQLGNLVIPARKNPMRCSLEDRDFLCHLCELRYNLDRTAS